VWGCRCRKPCGGGLVGCGVDPGLAEDLPDGGGGGLDAEEEQFARHNVCSPSWDSRGPGGAPAAGWTARYAVGPGARDGTWPRGGGPAGCGAIAAPCRGVSSSRIPPSRPRGSRCSTAARNTRSLSENCGRVVPSCRCWTVIWWRSTKISVSLSRSLVGSNANTFVTLR
jgi:hypothetical protein